MVYLPLTRLKGVFATIKVPAGLAVYNGSTGQLDCLSESIYLMMLCMWLGITLWDGCGFLGQTPSVHNLSTESTGLSPKIAWV